MKRRLLAGGLALVVLALIWAAGGAATPAQARYVVGPDGALMLEVENPGLFLDVLGGHDLKAQVGSRPGVMFAPWPGGRRRVLSLWRGPVFIAVAPGPVRADDLPVPVRGPRPSLDLPAGWRQVGNYIGKLEAVEGNGLTVAVPIGMEGGREAAGRALKLFSTASALTGTAPARSPVILLEGSEPERAARAVIGLWLPDYAEDAGWWSEGAADFYTMKLLDQAGAWTKSDRAHWLQAHTHSKGLSLAVWLDMSLKYQQRKSDGLDEVLRRSLTLHTNAELLRMVQDVGGLTIADKLDRMLRGREALPSVEL